MGSLFLILNDREIYISAYGSAWELLDIAECFDQDATLMVKDTIGATGMVCRASDLIALVSGQESCETVS